MILINFTYQNVIEIKNIVKWRINIKKSIRALLRKWNYFRFWTVIVTFYKWLLFHEPIILTSKVFIPVQIILILKAILKIVILSSWCIGVSFLLTLRKSETALNFLILAQTCRVFHVTWFLRGSHIWESLSKLISFSD